MGKPCNIVTTCSHFNTKLRQCCNKLYVNARNFFLTLSSLNLSDSKFVRLKPDTVTCLYTVPERYSSWSFPWSYLTLWAYFFYFLFAFFHNSLPFDFQHPVNNKQEQHQPGTELFRTVHYTTIIPWNKQHTDMGAFSLRLLSILGTLDFHLSYYRHNFRQLNSYFEWTQTLYTCFYSANVWDKL